MLGVVTWHSKMSWGFLSVQGQRQRCVLEQEWEENVPSPAVDEAPTPRVTGNPVRGDPHAGGSPRRGWEVAFPVTGWLCGLQNSP